MTGSARSRARAETPVTPDAPAGSAASAATAHDVAIDAAAPDAGAPVTAPPSHGVRASLGSLASRWRRSLQFRTVVATMLLTSVSFVAVGGVLSNQIASALYDQRFEQFRTEATELLLAQRLVFENSSATTRDTVTRLALDSLTSLADPETDAPRQSILVPAPGNEGYVPTLTSQDGATVSLLPKDLRAAVDAGSDVYWAPVSIPVIADGALRAPGVAFGTEVELPPDQRPYELYVYYDLSSMQATLDSIHRVLWTVGVALLLVIGAIAWYVTRSVVQPVSYAASVSEKLAAGQLEERMEVRGEDEVARLAASFNRMAGSLQDQITQLAELSQMQQLFVSDVSHELRTPLTTVRMAAEVLHDARADFDPINKRSAEILYDQVERFEALLADLLEISRFDAGAAVLEAESVDLVQLVQHALDGARPLADRLGSELRIVSEGARCIVDADSRRIDRILRNLVVNALEHGESRPVEVHIACGPDAAAVAVRDHGIGMTPLHASRVFDRFWRADPARARTTGGSGLGLSIATEDARLHGAWLEAWGTPGEGACFRLTLPRQQGVELTSSPMALPPRGGDVRPEGARPDTDADAGADADTGGVARTEGEGRAHG
ncbi:MtrAB system histidine kinase MtrB [Arthrobacter sp. RIT-PI-e]|uniref:MtrAB system histidine kinase MtrB n=1 Tax=Arthrobacter sp. RIT-PI-e TaxID=1681197 RepID=UPI0006764343|nr:MtrAB system histidine kinase MtrB [Arthrobacter sp. RIT-PI-e]